MSGITVEASAGDGSDVRQQISNAGRSLQRWSEMSSRCRSIRLVGRVANELWSDVCIGGAVQTAFAAAVARPGPRRGRAQLVDPRLAGPTDIFLVSTRYLHAGNRLLPSVGI
jgi:hypothetical protein